MDILSKKAIAQLYASGAIQKDDCEVYEYSLSVLLTSVLHTLTILVIGLIFGLFGESIVLFISFFLVRKFAGGFHATKQWQCYLVTVATVSGALLLLKFLLVQSDVFFYVLLSIVTLSIFMLSPAEHPNKPLSAKEKKVYRYISWGLCGALTALSAIAFNWASEAIGLAVCMGLLLGSISLIAAKVERMMRRR